MDNANRNSDSKEQDQQSQSAEQQQQQQQQQQQGEEVSPDHIIPDSMGTVGVYQMAGPSLKKVLSLQKAMQNKKVILLPGGSGCGNDSGSGNGTGDRGSLALTAETWEFERKVRLHKQLKLARRLRCVMEGALNEAKAEISVAGKEAGGQGGNNDDSENDNDKWVKMKQKKVAIREIFFRHTDDMLRLASLSNAVLGGYTMDSYEEYIQLQSEERKQEKETFESSQKCLNGLRQRMQWEYSSSSFFSDPKNRHLMMQPAPQSTTVVASTNKDKGTTSGSKTSASSSASSLSNNKQSEKKKGATTKVPKRSYNKKAGNSKSSSTQGSKATAQLKSFDFEFKVSKSETSHGQKKKRPSPQSKLSKNTNTKSTSSKKISQESKRTKGDDAASKNKSSNSTHNKDSSTTTKSPKKKQTNIFSHQLVSKALVSSIPAASSKVQRQSSSTSRELSSEEKNGQDVVRNTAKVKLSAKEQHQQQQQQQQKQKQQHPIQQQKEKIAKTPKVTKPKVKPTRKCHHCKKSTTDYSVCGYWFVSGNRCRKTFCSTCLAIYKMEICDKDDWHCPSCLGICNCAACVKGRERELLRATKRRRLRG